MNVTNRLPSPLLGRRRPAIVRVYLQTDLDALYQRHNFIGCWLLFVGCCWLLVVHYSSVGAKHIAFGMASLTAQKIYRFK
ncbi:hypothetical protein AM228_00980 [Planktothricoides sp. SR001]|nr:hypothetical protein AM228_00980 [Planktothricoides sp. SR001]